MNRTPLQQLLSSLDPQTVLYTITTLDSARVYTVRGGAIYHHRATASGHGCMVPQVSDRAAWLRLAQVCAWTAPSNPQCMNIGAAGRRLGDFWRGLSSAKAERAVSVPDLLSVALAPLALAPLALAQ